MKLSALLCALEPNIRVSIYIKLPSKLNKLNHQCVCIATPSLLLDPDSLLNNLDDDIDELLDLNVHTVTFDQNIVKIIVF